MRDVQPEVAADDLRVVGSIKERETPLVGDTTVEIVEGKEHTGAEVPSRFCSGCKGLLKSHSSSATAVGLSATQNWYPAFVPQPLPGTPFLLGSNMNRSLPNGVSYSGPGSVHISGELGRSSGSVVS